MKIMNNIIIKYNKSDLQFFAFEVLFLIINFFAAIIDRSGVLIFCTFCLSLLIVTLIYKNLNTLILFSTLSIVNNALANGELSVLSIRKIIFLILIIYLLQNLNYKGEKNISFKFLGIWIVYIVFTELIINKGGVASILSLLLLILLCMCLQIVAGKNLKLAKRVMITMMVAFTFIVLIAYLELIINKTFFYSVWTGEERYRNGIMRPGGTVLDPNNICLMIVPFYFLIKTSVYDKLIGKKINKLLQVLYFGIIVLSSSRTGLLAFIVCYIFQIVAKKKSVFLLTIPIAFFSLNTILLHIEKFFSNYAESGNYRNYIIEKSLSLWKNNKIFGLGTNSISLLSKGNNVNTMNTFVNILLTFGSIGLMFYVFYLLKLLIKEVKSWLKNKSDDVSILKICTVFSYAILAFSLDSLYMAVFWIIPPVFLAIEKFNEYERSGICVKR